MIYHYLEIIYKNLYFVKCFEIELDLKFAPSSLYFWILIFSNMTGWLEVEMLIFSLVTAFSLGWFQEVGFQRYVIKNMNNSGTNLSVKSLSQEESRVFFM